MLTRLKQSIRTYFGCTESETNGLLVLIPLILIFLAAPSVLKHLLKSDQELADLEDEKILQAWLLESKPKLKAQESDVVLPIFFNPNTADYDQWVELGFKEKIATRILKYRSNGGVFKKKEDLLNIYGINKKLVKEYYDYIIIPKLEQKEEEFKKPTKTKSPSRINNPLIAKYDLNQADTTQLKSIKGIGTVLSSRIIKYRDLLGGFIHLNQLKEVYGIKEEVFQRASEQLELSSNSIRKININSASFEELVKHPYLNYKDSKAIINYRNQHGNYGQLADLKKIYSLTDSVFQKITPYLEIDSSE